MFDHKERFLYFSSLCRFENDDVAQKYTDWKQSSRYAQISAATLLTSLLYVIYAILDSYIAPADVLPTMRLVHLFLLAPVLLLISLLAFWKSSYTIITNLLIVAPVFAACGNLLIVDQLNEYTTYLTELYLIIFWTFTISGLKLFHATISALMTFVVVFTVTYFFFSFPPELFLMHFFWMFATFSFGFLGAFLIERSSRTIFFKKEALETLAVTDTLTGLFNRSKLNTVLQEELLRSQRYQLNLGLVILDIDFFKDVNDTYGHEVGDSVLVDMSKLIKKHSRVNDILIRWGGEEFVIIYLGINKDEILRLAERVRLDIQEHTFEMVGSKTASFGVTVYQDGDTIKSIMDRADKALYISKNSGRNQISFV